MGRQTEGHGQRTAGHADNGTQEDPSPSERWLEGNLSLEGSVPSPGLTAQTQISQTRRGQSQEGPLTLLNSA